MISLCFLLASRAPANNVEIDLFGSLSESLSSNALALVPSASETTTSQGIANNLDSTVAAFAPPPSASNNFNPVGICLFVYTFTLRKYLNMLYY